MAMFNAKVEYALRAMLELASRDTAGALQSREIAGRQGIPEPYLDQLLATLRRAGMVRSIRGPSGGYVLGREPHRITVGDVVRACNGEEWLGSGATLEGPPAPSRATACVIQDLRERVGRAVAHILEETTIEDLIERRRQFEAAHAAMFHI